MVRSIYDVFVPSGMPFVTQRQSNWVTTTTTAGRPRPQNLNASTVINLRAFGAVGDGITDDTDAFAEAIAAALDSGFPLLIPVGIYLVSTIRVYSGLTILGESKFHCIIKQKAQSNTHLISGGLLTVDDVNVEGLVIANLTLDGDRDNQSSSSSGRLIYIVGASRFITIRDLIGKNCWDHGIMLSPGADFTLNAGQDSLVENIRLENFGAEGHTPGGSGCNGGCASTTWNKISAYNCYLNGMKTAGQHIFCDVNGHPDGSSHGGFEEQYFVGVPLGETSYFGCNVEGTGGGWRFNGTNHIARVINCSARNIGTSGITIFGGTREDAYTEIHIDQFTATNCGLVGARTATAGLDGISIIDPSAATPGRVFISNVRIVDDQAVKTTEYGLYVEPGVVDLHLSGVNDFRDLLLGPMLIGNSTDLDWTVSGRVLGWSGFERNNTPAVVTGTTAQTDLMSHTLKISELPVFSRVELFAAGNAVGTAGTKIVRVTINGATAQILSNQLAAEQEFWSCRIVFSNYNTVRRLFQIQAFEQGGASFITQYDLGLPSADDLVITFSGQLGSAADTISQFALNCRTEV